MNELQIIKAIQTKVGVKADGIIGPKTLQAIADKLGVEVPVQKPSTWPSQSEVRSGKSIFGAPGNESNLVSISPAYPLYFEGKMVKSIRVHKLIAKEVEAAFKDILSFYGPTKIKELRLDQYSGSFNDRSTTSGKAKSIHAWGIAIDFDAENNTYSMKKPKALLSRPECEEFINIMERHGAISLGRKANYDWMHFQWTKDFS